MDEVRHAAFLAYAEAHHLIPDTDEWDTAEACYKAGWNDRKKVVQ